MNARQITTYAIGGKSVTEEVSLNVTLEKDEVRHLESGVINFSHFCSERNVSLPLKGRGLFRADIWGRSATRRTRLRNKENKMRITFPEDFLQGTATAVQ